MIYNNNKKIDAKLTNAKKKFEKKNQKSQWFI